MRSKLSLVVIVGITMIFMLLGTTFVSASTLKAVTENCFTDVTTGMWFHDYVCWMYDKGLTVGYPDGTFRPFNPVSRAELAVFLQQISGEGSLGPIVDADLLDGSDSLDFANASHDHFAQTFNGSSVSSGLTIQNNGLGSGLESYANSQQVGLPAVLYGQSASNNGRGVQGVAIPQPPARPSGVFGESA